MREIYNRYFYLTIFFYLLYLANIYLVHNNSFSESLLKCLLLTYDGGFVRRALLGHFVSYVSIELKINFVQIFFVIFILIYSIFFILFFNLTKKFKYNFLFYFFVFSPIGFIYPLIQLEFPISILLAQREIFLITFFLFFNYLIIKNLKRSIIFFTGIIGTIILILLYELTFFCIPFFVLIYFVYLKKNNYKIKMYEVLILTLILMILLSAHLILYGTNNLDQVFNNIFIKNGIILSLKDKYCTFDWMNKKIIEQIIVFQENFKISQIIRYFFYSHPVLLLFYLNTKNNNDSKVNFLLFFSIIFSSILFLIATDWARFVHIIYFFTLISFFTIFYSDKNIFVKVFNNSFLKKINPLILNSFLFVYCTFWTLKQTYWQNHLSYGGIKIIFRTFESFFSQSL